MTSCRVGAIGHAHMFGWTGLIASPCPSPPACGGRGRGPARLRREGEVGSSAVRAGGFPHLTPTLSAPKGGEGGYSGRLTGREICACPSASAGATEKEEFRLTIPQTLLLLADEVIE
jgi:hypothetical protein